MVVLHLSLSHLESNSTEELIYLFLKASHTTFAGVSLDDELQSGLANLESRMLLQSVLFAVLWDKVPLGNLNLFFCNVSVNLDDFHTVE